MTTYAVYVPTAGRSVRGLRLEKFPSREVAGNSLLERAVNGAGRTWYVKDGTAYGNRPVDTWEPHDATGYLRVWVRRAADPVPGAGEIPDEEWIIRPGGRRGVVERLPWK